MKLRVNQPLLWLAVALLVFGAIMRLVPHPANFVPVGAIALFGGAVLPRKLAWWLPLTIVAIPDIFLNFSSNVVFGWLGLFLVGLLGIKLSNASNWFRVPFGAMCGAMIFFIVSNFGIWLTSSDYAHTFAGFVDCYTMGLPFFRNTFYGVVLYSWLLFGAYALASRCLSPNVPAIKNK